MRIFDKTHISAGTTTLTAVVPCAQQCVLRYVTVNTPSAGTTTIYDSVSGTGTVVGIITAASVGATYRYDCAMSKGINVQTTTLADLTVVYEKI
jgi:hypothetical protein